MAYKYGDWIGSSGTYYGKARMYYQYTFGSPSKPNNTVTVTVSGRVETNINNMDGASNKVQYRAQMLTPQLTIAGSIYNGSGVTVASTGTNYTTFSGLSSKSKTIAYATVTGTGSVTIKITSSVYIQKRISNDGGSTWTSWVDVTSGTSNVTATISLPTNARQSVLTYYSGQGTVEGEHYCNYTQYVSGATQTLKSYAYYNGQWYGTHTIENYVSGAVFQFTAAELADIYANVPVTSAPMYYELTTYLNGTSLGTSYTNRPSSIIDTITAGALSYADTNATTVALSGSNQNIIQNQSSLAVTIGEATVDKSASIVSYAIYINDVLMATESAAGTYSLGTQDLSTNAVLKLVITDSRGQSVTVTLTITVIAWTAPTATTTLQRVNNFESTATLAISAQWASEIVNNVLSLSYRYKLSSATSYTTGSSALTNGATTTLAETFNSGSVYNVQVVVADSLGSTTIDLILPKGVPLLYLDAKKSSIGIGDLPSGQEVLSLAKGLEVVGSSTITLTADELIEKLSSGGSENKSITYSGLTSGVTVDWFKAYKSGKIVTIYAKFSKSAATASGSNALTCSLTNMAGWLPPYDVEGFGYYSSCGFGMRLESDGSVTVRNASASSRTLTDGIQFSLTYVIA